MKVLAVAVGIVMAPDNRLLLIKRTRGDYRDYWALLGGKIEPSEHIIAAAQREIQEEAGLSCARAVYRGTVSELFMNDEAQEQKHFLLHIVELFADTTAVRSTDAGELSWFTVDEVFANDAHKLRIVPSDLKIIESFALNSSPPPTYFECAMRGTPDNLKLLYFRRG